MVDLVNSVEEPIDLILMSLKEKVYVKCRHGRELKGKLAVINHIPQVTLILTIGI